MYKINCLKKSGFKHPSKSVFYIYDYRGVLFYTNEILKKKECSFNLPEGVYYSKTKFIQLSRPNKTKNIKLPKKERDLNFKKFTISFKPNPNKATVFYENPNIVFDTYYKTCPLPELFFTFFHELGHRYFATEKYCDLFAAKNMLEMGFNISQIGKSSVLMLSDRAKDRKIYLVDKLINE
jgi:hypothetical protein